METCALAGGEPMDPNVRNLACAIILAEIAIAIPVLVGIYVWNMVAFV